MKKIILSLVLLLFAFVSPSLRADSFWDPDGIVVGSSVTGNWDTLTPNWSVAFDAGGNTTWLQGDNANFQVWSDFTVTVTEPITNASIVVSGTNGILTINRTAANGLTLSADSLFNITGSRTLNLNAPLGGTFSIIKSGNGTVTMSAANTYSGGTTLSSGSGSIGINVDTVSSGGIITSGPLGTGTININTAGHILFASGGARALQNAAVMNAGVTIGGSQPLVISNGNWQVFGGTRIITVNNTADTIFESNLTDDGTARTFQKAGNGKLVMRSGNSTTFLGTISATAGTLAAGNGTPFPTNNANQITINGPAILDLNGNDVTLARLGGNGTGQVLLGANTLTAGGSQSAEFMGVISGTGGYVKVGSISQVLSGTNTFSGGITITAGSLYLPTNAVAGSPIALGAGFNTITITGSGRIGANRASPSISIVTNKVILNTATAGLDAANGGDFVLAGQVSGTGGILRTTQGSGLTVLANSNIFSGGVQIEARPFGMANKNALGTGPFIIGNPTTAPGNTIELASYNVNLTGANAVTNAVTINQNFSFGTRNGLGLELGGPVFVSAGIKALTIVSNGLFKLSGNISGDGGFTKFGDNALVLSGNNTYAGDTVVAQGALFVNNTTGSGTSTGLVTVSSGALLGGSGTIAGPTSIQGGTVAPGASAGKLTFGNGLDLTLGTYNWELMANKDDASGVAGQDFDQIALTGGNVALAGALQISVTNAASFPSSTNAFWQANHTWKIVSLSGGASNSGSSNFGSITGTNGFDAGTFSTSVDGSGNVFLNFVSSTAPRPVIESYIAGAGTTNATIKWSSVNGVNYEVQYKNALTNGPWNSLGLVTAGGSTAQITDTNTPVAPMRFYRVVVQ